MEKLSQKEANFKYIKMFSAISVKEICTDLGIEKDYSNIMKGISSSAKLEKVAKEIERRLLLVGSRNKQDN